MDEREHHRTIVPPDQLVWYGRERIGPGPLRFIGVHRMRRHTPIDRHRLNCYELALVESGELAITIAGRSTRVRAHQFAPIRPAADIASASPPNAATVYWVGLALTRDSLAALPPHVRADVEAVREAIEARAGATLPMPEELLDAARNCFRAVAEERPAVARFACAMGLVAAIAQAFAAPPPPSGGEASLIAPALRMLDAGPPEGLPVDTLADACHMSRSTFTDLFKRVQGVPPHTWINRRRIQHATALLAKTAEPVERIAARLGFSSAQHLATVFKTLMGTSPTAYRVQARTKTSAGRA